MLKVSAQAGGPLRGSMFYPKRVANLSSSALVGEFFGISRRGLGELTSVKKPPRRERWG